MERTVGFGPWRDKTRGGDRFIHIFYSEKSFVALDLNLKDMGSICKVDEFMTGAGGVN